MAISSVMQIEIDSNRNGRTYRVYRFSEFNVELDLTTDADIFDFVLKNPNGIYSGLFSKFDNCRLKVNGKVIMKGNLDKVANHLLKEKDEVHEAIETGIIIGLGIIVAFITLCFSIRVFTYYFYYTRMQLADYFNQQAQFINMHKSEVNKNSNLTAVEKKDIIEAQKKWADVFTDISEMIVDDDIKSAKKVKTEINNSNKDLNPSNNIDVPNTGLDFF